MKPQPNETLSLGRLEMHRMGSFHPPRSPAFWPCYRLWGTPAPCCLGTTSTSQTRCTTRESMRTIHARCSCQILWGKLWLVSLFYSNIVSSAAQITLQSTYIILTVDRVGVAEVLDCLLDDWPCELFSSYVLVEQASLGETDIRLDSGSISPHYFVGVLSASAGLPLVQYQNVFAQLSADMQ